MNLKDSLDKLIISNKEACAFIKKTNEQSADTAIKDYSEYLLKTNYNSGLSLSFAYLLQFGSDPTIYEQYELKDIELLYESFIELNNYCLDIYIDAANFAEAVLDNKVRARQIVDIGINKLKIQLAEL